jgi:3-oxoacyl-[acyl-carrier protein] reductase
MDFRERWVGRLDGKTALVTGAGRGIGRGIAKRLAADGARVVVHYSASQAAAEALAREIEADGGSALTAGGDLTDTAAIEAMFAALAPRIGRLDILVNNAGRSGGTPLADATPETFDAIFAINTRGLFFVTQAAVALMADGGRVINISSNAANLRLTGLAAYAASKAAVDAFTRCWSAELAPRRINVNSLQSGIVETDMIRGMAPEFRAARIASIPLGRMGQVEDIADVTAFLASDDARWITGQSIAVTGGN